MLSGAHLREAPHATAAMLAVWNDAAWLRAALGFEAALAGAEAESGIIPEAAASLIARVAADFTPDAAALAQAASHAGTLAIPLIAALREAVAGHDAGAASFVHHGATSQDLADTAMVLQARAGIDLLMADLARAGAALAGLAATHADTRMSGRTLLQPALPVTFGLKCAQWMAALADAGDRLHREAGAALLLQLGGGAGTLDGMQDHGAAVSASLARRLGLRAAPLPWHARRGNIAGLAAALAIATGEAGKMARDVALLAQAEVAEAREPVAAGRGGSSAMPHKRNQTLCQRAITASLRAPPLAATIIAGLPQEHERGLGGWQAEAPVLAELFCVAHSAITAMAETAEGLTVDPAAMRRNLDAAGIGTTAGEAVRLIHAALAAREPG